MVKHSRSPSSSDDDDDETPSGVANKRRATTPPPPPPAAAHASTPSPSPSPWAGLTYGPVGLIAEHALANDVSDYVCFRAVCRAWRRGTEATATPHERLQDRRFYPHRWIMLREAAAAPAPGQQHRRRRFLNVCTGQCVQTELPELDGHHILGATAEGILVLLDESSYVVRLLNPATRHLAVLPSLGPLLPPETREQISEHGSLAHALKVTGLGLIADDGDESSWLAISFFTPTMLVVARPGDGHWTVVDVVGRGNQWFYSAMSFRGRFYCANAGAVMTLAPSSTTTTINGQSSATPPRLVVVAKITFDVSVSLTSRDTVHLVESDGRLLLLRRWLQWRRRSAAEGMSCSDTKRYRAYEVDLAARKTVVPDCGRPLRGRAVFLGKTRALSVSPLVFPMVRRDTVYPAADSSEKCKQGVGSYSLVNGWIERCSVKKRRKDDGGGGGGDNANGWTRPRGICDYLSWYVSGRCNDIEEI